MNNGKHLMLIKIIYAKTNSFFSQENVKFAKK